MTALVWDAVGERLYETGVDRGVFYPQGGVGIAWNGLIGIDESPNSELKSFYLDGVKFLETVSPDDFVGMLKAYTYPESFDFVNGMASPVDGLYYHSQPPKSFNLTYRTKVGNDLDGTDHGYKIHLLYNLVADPQSSSYGTLKDSLDPVEFSWSLTGTPPKLPGYRPTVHVTIDSLFVNPDILAVLEGILYGTEDADPTFPSILDLTDLIATGGGLVITDLGDGRWTATDIAGDFLVMDDATTFHIDHADVVIIDADSYTITSTPEPIL